MKHEWISLILSFFLCYSCGKKEEDKIPLFTSPATEETVDGNTEYLVNKLYEDDFDKMIEKKMSFPLFVYAAGCGTCDNFSIVLKDYIRIHHVIFPYMTLSVFHQSKASTPNLSDSALLFYKGGKLVRNVDDILSRVFTTKDFEKIMEQECQETSVQYLSSTYTYWNTKVPFLSYHFTPTLTLPPEKEKEVGHLQFDISKTDSLLLLLKEPTSYSSLYDYLSESGVDAFAYTEDSKENLENLFHLSFNGDYLRIEIKNGSAIKAEAVTLR